MISDYVIDDIEKIYHSKEIGKKKYSLDKKKSKEQTKQQFEKILRDKMTKTK